VPLRGRHVHDRPAAEAPGHRGDGRSGQPVRLQPPHSILAAGQWDLASVLRCHEAHLRDPAGTEAVPPAAAPGAEETRAEIGPAARSGTTAAATACHPGTLRKNANARQGRRDSSSVHIHNHSSCTRL